MKIKRALTLICLVIFAGSAALAGGYQAAEWGMSPAQVVASFPDEKFSYPKAKHGFSLFYDELLGFKVFRRFVFSKAERLYKVEIEPISTALPGATARKVEKAWPDLQAAMHKKYGKPNNCTTTTGGVTIEGNCMSPSGFVGEGAVTVNIMEGVTGGYTAYREWWIVEDTKITLQASMVPILPSNPNRGLIWDDVLIYQDVNFKGDDGPVPDIGDEI